jgi:hypothetical protein
MVTGARIEYIRLWLSVPENMKIALTYSSGYGLKHRIENDYMLFMRTQLAEEIFNEFKDRYSYIPEEAIYVTLNTPLSVQENRRYAPLRKLYNL